MSKHESMNLDRNSKRVEHPFAPKFDTGEHAYIGKGDCRCGVKWGTQAHCSADRDPSRCPSKCSHRMTDKTEAMK